MKKLFIAIILVCVTTMLHAQLEIPSIPGWKVQEQQGGYRYMPAAPAVGKVFIYDLMPLQKGADQSGATWFKGLVQANAQQEGFTVAANDNTRVNEQSGLYNYTTQVSDKKGNKWLLSYIGYQMADGQYRLARMLSSPDATYFKTNIQPAVTHFGKVAKADGLVIKGNGRSSGGATADRSSGATRERKTSTPKVKPEELMTANGLKPGEVKGIAIHQEYTFGVGGMMITTYEPYLLLADGSIYNDPIISPYKFDVAKSKQLEPKKWGTWKAVGKTIVISWPNKDKEKDRAETWEKNWFWTRPATNGEKIEGAFNTISGGGNTALGGNVMVVSATDIAFNKTGQFTMASVGGGSNSGDMGVSTTAYSHKDAAGTYVLNGFSLELRYNNGKVEHKAFYFYPDSKDVLGIGTRAYTPKGKKSKKG